MAGSRRRSRRTVLGTLGVLGLTSLTGCAGRPGGGNGSITDSNGDGSNNGSSTTTIFHAGSLSPPFADGEQTFLQTRGIPVNREAKGSVASTKKITELNRAADVLAVSDYRLLRDLLLPEYGSWYAIFATNAMTIAYTDDSTGADSIGTNNWWEVLGREDVTFAHSDPAVDPNGYRAVQSLRLGAMSFDGTVLYEESTARTLEEKAIVPAATETDLIGQLQTGAIDYAWNYQSISASYDVKTVDLQPQVSLSQITDRYAEHYAEATVEAGGDTYTGAPIAYGITVPSVAQNPDSGAAWIAYILSQAGRTLLENNGFTPVTPAVVPAGTKEDLPETIAAHVQETTSLGPLAL